VDAVREEGVCVADDRADVEIMLKVLDRNVEAVSSRVEIGDDRLSRPVPVVIENIPAISMSEQLLIQPFVLRPWTQMWSDANRSFVSHRNRS
jgi:hypothetical protein